MIFIYTAFANQKEAQKIAKIILEKKMAVCVNIWPISSLYWENNKIEECQEVGVLFKTLNQNYKRIKEEITQNHSYKVPFVGAIKINQINEPYYHYLKKTVIRYYGKKSPEAKPNLKNPKIKRKIK